MAQIKPIETQRNGNMIELLVEFLSHSPETVFYQVVSETGAVCMADHYELTAEEFEDLNSNARDIYQIVANAINIELV